MIQQVKEALADIEEFKTMDMFDQALVEKMIQRFKAHKAIIRELAHEANALYTKAKEEVDVIYINKYREYRKTMTQKDSEVEAKFETLKAREAKIKWQAQRDKARAMCDDIEDIVISLQVARKYNFTQIKYG